MSLATRAMQCLVRQGAICPSSINLGKMTHQSLHGMIRNGPLKISKWLKKLKWSIDKNLSINGSLKYIPSMSITQSRCPKTYNLRAIRGTYCLPSGGFEPITCPQDSAASYVNMYNQIVNWFSLQSSLFLLLLEKKTF